MDAFDRAKQTILEVAASTRTCSRRLRDAGLGPIRCRSSSGSKFSVQGNIIVAGATAKAALLVRLTYGAPPPA